MKNKNKILFIANWKTNPKNTKEAIALFKSLDKELKLLKNKIVVCPPSIFLSNLSTLKTNTLYLGLQNTTIEDTGAYTGQVSLEQALSFKIKYTLVGHSEMRALGDTDDTVSLKVKYAVKKGITPIVCVGEHNRDDNHFYFDFIENQVTRAFSGMNKKDISKTIIAYEPLWAIGKNATRDATPLEFIEIKIFIQKILKDTFGIVGSSLPKILYGGSVNEKNARDFIHEGKADGLLIGRTSLDSKKMITLIKNT